MEAEEIHVTGPAEHLFPPFGPRHVNDLSCWCHPECVNLVEYRLGLAEQLVILHNVAH